MIQRIQSLFLLVAFIACLLMFFFPFAMYYRDSVPAVMRFDIRGIHDIAPDPVQRFSSFLALPVQLLTISLMGLSLWTFYSFKKRIFQIKLLRFAVLFNVLLIAILFYLTSFVFEKQLGTKTVYEPAIWFPLISFVMLLLANRYIRKDEILVRSADRLR